MSSRAEVNSYLGNSGEQTRISAEYVIAHAARQAQRGKGPSVAFLGHRNPEKALAAATATQIQEIGKVTLDPVIRAMRSEYALHGSSRGAMNGHVWGD